MKKQTVQQTAQEAYYQLQVEKAERRKKRWAAFREFAKGIGIFVVFIAICAAGASLMIGVDYLIAGSRMAHETQTIVHDAGRLDKWWKDAADSQFNNLQARVRALELKSELPKPVVTHPEWEWFQNATNLWSTNFITLTNCIFWGSVTNLETH